MTFNLVRAAINMTDIIKQHLRSNPRTWLALALPMFAVGGLMASANQGEPSSDSTTTVQSASDQNAASQDAESTDRAAIATDDAGTSVGATTYVDVIQVRRRTGDGLSRIFTGTLVAKRASDLGFKRTGRITKVLADQGDRVRQGDVIAEMDTATIEAEMEVARAQRRAAAAKLDELIAGPRLQSIEAAKAVAAELKALRDQAAMVYERRRRLGGGDAISQQDVDDARLQLAASEGRLAAQKQILAELQEGTRKEQILAQEAMVAQLDASLASLQVQLDESRLIAPFDAMIARRMADEGTVVGPGTIVVRLVEAAAPEIWVGVPPDFVSQLAVDQQQEVMLRGQSRKSKVRAILPELDTATRTQTVVLQLIQEQGRGDDDLFSLGQIAQLRLTQNISQTGYWLPLTALTQGVRGLWSAYVVNRTGNQSAEPSGVIRRVDLEVLQIDTDRVLVSGTLQDGDLVVVGGVQKLTNGQQVWIAAQEPSTTAKNETTDLPADGNVKPL